MNQSSDQSRLDLLREALPYIQRFKGKIFVVKFSGKATEERATLFSLAEEVALLHNVGIRTCVVHGGGKQLSELAAQLGVEQTIINGRRITDDATLDIAKMVFAGKINTEILAALRSTGAPAVGLSGIDGNLVEAVRRPIGEVFNHATGASETIDYGHVGDVVEVNTGVLEVLLTNDYLPVVASLAADAQGGVFNINADTLAAEIAVHLQAEKLVLLGDTNGIYLDPHDSATKLPRLTAAEASRLITEGTASGGMIPKLQSITSLLERGVHSAHIINGNRRNSLLAEVFTDEGTGTMVVR